MKLINILKEIEIKPKGKLVPDRWVLPIISGVRMQFFVNNIRFAEALNTPGYYFTNFSSGNSSYEKIIEFLNKKNIRYIITPLVSKIYISEKDIDLRNKPEI